MHYIGTANRRYVCSKGSTISFNCERTYEDEEGISRVDDIHIMDLYISDEEFVIDKIEFYQEEHYRDALVHKGFLLIIDDLYEFYCEEVPVECSI
jgi:hypothetical protein